MTIALADNALTNLATIKEDLGISAATWDQQLIRYINAASDMIFISGLLIS